MPRHYLDFSQVSSSSSSSESFASSYVNDDGAGGSSHATAISPTGEISSSSDTVFTEGATSSSASASASVSTDNSPTTSATTKAPATDTTTTDTSSPQPTSLSTSSPQEEASDTTILDSTDDDSLLGEPENTILAGGDGNDVLNSNSGTDILIGGSGGDLFVLRAETSDPLVAPTIADFNAAEGDTIGIVTNRFDPTDLVFEVFDSTGNGVADATLVKFGIYVLAVVSDTVDAQGSSTLGVSNFVPVQDTFLS